MACSGFRCCSRSAWIAKSTIMMPFFLTMPVSSLERGVECLRRPLERAEDGARHADRGRGLLDGADRLAKRHARCQIERQRDCGELALVIDRQVARVRGVETGEGRQRYLLIGER